MVYFLLKEPSLDLSIIVIFFQVTFFNLTLFLNWCFVFLAYPKSKLLAFPALSRKPAVCNMFMLLQLGFMIAINTLSSLSETGHVCVIDRMEHWEDLDA